MCVKRVLYLCVRTSRFRGLVKRTEKAALYYNLEEVRPGQTMEMKREGVIIAFEITYLHTYMEWVGRTNCVNVFCLGRVPSSTVVISKKEPSIILSP